jgi:hypothetical protein
MYREDESAVEHTWWGESAGTEVAYQPEVGTGPASAWGSGLSCRRAPKLIESGVIGAGDEVDE